MVGCGKEVCCALGGCWGCYWVGCCCCWFAAGVGIAGVVGVVGIVGFIGVVGVAGIVGIVGVGIGVGVVGVVVVVVGWLTICGLETVAFLVAVKVAVVFIREIPADCLIRLSILILLLNLGPVTLLKSIS